MDVSWTVKKAESWKIDAFWTVVLGKNLESPLDFKDIQPVHPKGDQSGRTDVEAETPILWPPDAKSWLIGKDPDAGRDWGAEGEGDDRGWSGLDGIERVTGRKARGLQLEEIACKCQTVLSLLSSRRKQTCYILFPSLYKFKRRFLLKYSVAVTPGFTWS